MTPGKYDASFSWLVKVKGDCFSGSPNVSLNGASLVWNFMPVLFNLFSKVVFQKLECT